VALRRGQSCGLESEDRDGEGLAEGHLVPGPCELVAGTPEGRVGRGWVKSANGWSLGARGRGANFYVWEHGFETWQNGGLLVE